MDETIRAYLADIRSGDRAAQGRAYAALLGLTEAPVPWAYDAWDDLVQALGHRDNRLRSIASQVLCNLAKSDPKRRILKDFDALLAVTRDERFVTARHCLLSLWKVGAAGPAQKRLVIDRLAARFADCAAEKNATLIRHDILLSLRQLYDLAPDEALRATALALVEAEPDPKYRKKYAGAWKVK